MHFQKPMLGVPLDWSNHLNKGLVMHLAMNEGHGDVVRDLSMNGNHGTLGGMAFPSTPASGWNPGRTGVGLNFDGTDDYIDCGHSESLNFSGEISLSVWIYYVTQIDGFPRIVGKPYDTASWSGLCYGLGITNATNKIRFGTDGGSFDSNTVLSTNNWYNVVMTNNGNESTLYVNGDYDISPANPFTEASTEHLSISSTKFAGVRDYEYTGSIDQVRIHNRALTAKEVKDYYINPWQVYLDK